MQKRVVLFSVFLICIFALSLVSAAWYSPFTDFWGKITGKTITENSQCLAGYVSISNPQEKIGNSLIEIRSSKETVDKWAAENGYSSCYAVTSCDPTGNKGAYPDKDSFGRICKLWTYEKTAGWTGSNWQVHTCDFSSWKWDDCYTHTAGVCCSLPTTLVIFIPGLGADTGDVFSLFNTDLSKLTKANGKKVDIKLFSYDSTKDTNEVSADLLNKKLLGEYNALSYSKVYIIGHSLGNTIVRDAVSQIPTSKLNADQTKLKAIYAKTTVFQISPIFGGAEYGKWAAFAPFAGLLAPRWKEFEPAATYQNNLFSKTQTKYFDNSVLNHYTFVVVNDFTIWGVWNQLRKNSNGQTHVDLWDGDWAKLFVNAISKNYFEFYLNSNDKIKGRKEIQISVSQISGSQKTDEHRVLLNYVPLEMKIINKILYNTEINIDAVTSDATGNGQISCSNCAVESDCDTLCGKDTECKNFCLTQTKDCNFYCTKGA